MPEYSPDDLERRETEAFVDPGSALPDVLGCVGMGATSADSPANDVPNLWPLGEEDGDEPEAVDVDNDPEQIPLDSAEPADMLHSQSSESSDARCCVRNIVKEMRSLERGGQISHTMIQKEAFRTERRGNVFFSACQTTSSTVAAKMPMMISAQSQSIWADFKDPLVDTRIQSGPRSVCKLFQRCCFIIQRFLASTNLLPEWCELLWHT